MKEIAIIDIVIILSLVFFLIKGFQQGLIRQTMALVGLILGLKLASDEYQFVATFIKTEFAVSDTAANIIGFAVILIIVMLVVNLIGWILRSLTKVLFLSFLDRIIGAILGLVKGGIIVYLVLLLISKVPYGLVANQLDKSFLAKDLLSLTPQIQDNLDQIIRPKIDLNKNAIPPKNL